MRYRKIPFLNSPGSLMHGLTPLIAPAPASKASVKPRRPVKGFGPMFPSSNFLGHISPSKFFGEESADNDNGIVNDLDPLFRNFERTPFGINGLGDALPAGTSTTVMLRPQTNAPAGFPGFFAWLKSEQPDMWNYAKAARPAYVTQAEGKRTGGATLQGLGAARTIWGGRPGFFGEEQANDQYDGVANARDPMFSRKPYVPDLDGLGDDEDTDSTTLIDPSTIDTISTPMPTVSIPDSSAETSSIGTPPNPGPSAVASIVSTLTAAAPSILNTVNQQTLFNAQLARAQAGLPPLNTSAYGLPSSLTALASSSAFPLILIGGALALFMVMKK